MDDQRNSAPDGSPDDPPEASRSVDGDAAPAAHHTMRREVSRYAWPLRLFIAYYLFDAVVRSLITLTPFDDGWRKELAMERMPALLPTPLEVKKIRQGKDEKYESVAERYQVSLQSVVEFASPWPDEGTQNRIDDAESFGKYVLVWVGTRLSFVGALLGLDQNWPMFSPNVRKSRVVPRAKLVFADDSAVQLWLLAEPFDLTEYSRWFIKRPLQIDIRLDKDYDSRMGVSQHLARLYPYSSSGSKLRFVEFYNVRYTLPRPGQDAHAVLSKQNRKATDADPFWRYDVESGKGKTFEDPKQKEAKRKKEAKKKKEREKKKQQKAAREAEARKAAMEAEQRDSAEADPEEDEREQPEGEP